MSITVSARKTLIKRWADSVARERDEWIERNQFFYADDQAYMQFLVRPGLRVLEIGCGTGPAQCAHAIIWRRRRFQRRYVGGRAR